MATARPRSPAGRRRGATIVDVARLSGVSKSTVSNVLRNYELVADNTRERVMEAIERLDYRPNAVARDLKRMRTATVGIIVGDLANPFYAELTQLLEQRTTSAGYTTIMCDVSGDAAAERERMGLLLEQRVSGVLMTYLIGDEAMLAEVERSGVPLVGVSVSDRRLDCVACHEGAGARLAVEHLAQLGHSRVAYVYSGQTEPATNAARLRGMRTALRRAGLPAGPSISLGEPKSRGHTALTDVISDPDRPTAFLAGNDVTALQLIDRLESSGLRVPRDASVIGFDDIAIARLNRLSLTTLRQPIVEIAERGVARLLERMESGEGADGAVMHRRLKAQLIVRGTTAAPPRRR